MPFENFRKLTAKTLLNSDIFLNVTILFSSVTLRHQALYIEFRFCLNWISILFELNFEIEFRDFLFEKLMNFAFDKSTPNYFFSCVHSAKRNKKKGKLNHSPTQFKTFTAGQCGVSLGSPNVNTFVNLPKFRKRRGDDEADDDENEFSSKSRSSKNKTVSGRSKMFQQRIVGGAPSSKLAWPWQVFIDFIRYSCGGTLMSNEWLITARDFKKDAGVAVAQNPVFQRKF